ncbi:MAG: hypothetical protein ASUL_08409 [Candidatus Aramenus sulfurataquae]|jgi:hypothetical protein|uniref:Uncharacterized protein n=3 Tax=Candidatus Aramenus sulfurataquae TaxID=1326980 RepID=W7L521_9CREN|nr:MAG: hypothetical protein ASUL_08409 [Candidatus Aramenus sulfurataquae]MCL7344962.1 hypothetical protein [Candidatus Aramenus sulfurataquae]
MRQNLLVALLVVTLAANVALGIELYTALHPGTTAFPGPGNSGSYTSQPAHVNTTQEYSFSYKFIYVFPIKREGEYVIGIKPNASLFQSLYVIIQFKNGKTVELTLYNTSVLVHLEKEDRVAVVFVTGVSYQNVSSQDIMNYVNLYYQQMSSKGDSSD